MVLAVDGDVVYAVCIHRGALWLHTPHYHYRNQGKTCGEGGVGGVVI